MLFLLFQLGQRPLRAAMRAQVVEVLPLVEPQEDPQAPPRGVAGVMNYRGDAVR